LPPMPESRPASVAHEPRRTVHVDAAQVAGSVPLQAFTYMHDIAVPHLLRGAGSGSGHAGQVPVMTMLTVPVPPQTIVSLAPHAAHRATPVCSQAREPCSSRMAAG
jgi:hypothetical protein